MTTPTSIARDVGRPSASIKESVNAGNIRNTETGMLSLETIVGKMTIPTPGEPMTEPVAITTRMLHWAGPMTTPSPLRFSGFP